MLQKVTLIALLPALAAAAYCPALPSPSPSSAASCGSIHPKWTLSSMDLSSYYTYASPSASSTSVGSISFTFANNQVDYTASCAGSSVNPQGIFYSFQDFDCVTPGGSANAETSFSFDTASETFAVNSTWTCNGGDVVYQVSGSGKADLQCTTSTWTNPDWQAGEIYSNTTTVCQPASLVIQT